MTQHRIYNQAKWCITMCLLCRPSQEWPLKFENSALKARFTIHHSPSNRMDGIKCSIFKMATAFLLQFYVFVAVMSSIQLNIQIVGSSDTPALQCIIPHRKTQLQSFVMHHHSSSGTCTDCGKFHNTFSIVMITNWSFFSEVCILSTAAD